MKKNLLIASACSVALAAASWAVWPQLFADEKSDSPKAKAAKLAETIEAAPAAPAAEAAVPSTGSYRFSVPTAEENKASQAANISGADARYGITSQTPSASPSSGVSRPGTSAATPAPTGGYGASSNFSVPSKPRAAADSSWLTAPPATANEPAAYDGSSSIPTFNTPVEAARYENRYQVPIINNAKIREAATIPATEARYGSGSNFSVPTPSTGTATLAAAPPADSNVTEEQVQEAAKPEDLAEPPALAPSTKATGSAFGSFPKNPDFSTFEHLGKRNSLTQIIQRADRLYVTHDQHVRSAELAVLDDEAKQLLINAISKTLHGKPNPEQLVTSSPDHKFAHIAFNKEDWEKYGWLMPELVSRLQAESKQRRDGRQSDVIEQLLGRASPEESAFEAMYENAEPIPYPAVQQRVATHYPDGKPYSETNFDFSDTSEKRMHDHAGRLLHVEGDNYNPSSQGIKIDMEATAVAQTLANCHKIVFVIDRDKWKYHPFSMVDPTAQKQFAQVLIHMLQQDEDVEGNRFELHPDGLHIFFSQEGYERNEKLFDAVMVKLMNEARLRKAEEEDKQRGEQERQVQELLRAAKDGESASFSLLGQDGFEYRLVLKENGVGKVQYQVEPAQVDHDNPLYVGQTFTGLTPFQPEAPGENVKVDADVIAGFLDSTNVLRIVVDQEQWMIVLVSRFADAQTHQQLATAVVAAIDKDPSYEGNRVTLYPGMLEIHFSKEGYLQYGQHLGQVVNQINQTLAQSSIFNAAIRRNELLSATQKAKPGDKARSIEVDTDSIAKALKSIGMLRILSDVPGHFQRFPVNHFDEPALRTLAETLRKKVEDNPPAQGEKLELHPDELYVHLSPRGFQQLRQELPTLHYNLGSETIQRKTGNSYPKLAPPPSTNTGWGQGYQQYPNSIPPATYNPPRYPGPTVVTPYDPALYQDEAQALQLAGKLRNFQGSDEEKQKLVTELKATLKKAFNVRLDRQRKQLEEAEAKLKSSRELLDKRQDNADTIIQRRLDELTGNQEMQWNFPGTHKPSAAPASGYSTTPALPYALQPATPSSDSYPPAYVQPSNKPARNTPVQIGPPADWVPTEASPPSVIAPATPKATNQPKPRNGSRFVPQQSPPSKQPLPAIIAPPSSPQPGRGNHAGRKQSSTSHRQLFPENGTLKTSNSQPPPNLRPPGPVHQPNRENQNLRFQKPASGGKLLPKDIAIPQSKPDGVLQQSLSPEQLNVRAISSVG